MSCCAALEWEPDEKINGVCPSCGADTIDGEAEDQCSYSPLVCEECNSSPCDLSC